MPKARIKIAKMHVEGVMLLEGQRIPFSADVKGEKIDADFPQEDDIGQPIDAWKAFRALDTFIDENLRG